jgi:hypothetical protein
MCDPKRGRRVLVTIVAWVASVSFVQVGRAATQYDFVQEGTVKVLAVLELSGPQPYQHGSVDSLSFTEAGNDIFGLGAGVYSGTFTETVRSWFGVEDDGMMGLVGVGNNNITDRPTQFFSYDGPVPGLPGATAFESLGLSFGVQGFGYRDGLWLDYEAGPERRQMDADGQFFLRPSPAIPEPTALIVWSGLAVVVLTVFRRPYREQ